MYFKVNAGLITKTSDLWTSQSSLGNVLGIQLKGQGQYSRTTGLGLHGIIRTHLLFTSNDNILAPAVLDSLSGYTRCFKLLQEHINSNTKSSRKDSSFPL